MGGNKYSMIQGANKITESGNTGSSIAEKTNITAEELKKYTEGAFKDYSEGKYQTTKTLQNITLENLTTDLTKMYEDMGLYGNNIITAIEGLGTLLTTWLATNLIGNILGTGGGKFIGGMGATLLQTFGPALGIGATVVGIGSLINGIYSKIVNGDNDNAAEAEKAYNEAKKLGMSEEDAQQYKANTWLKTAYSKHETSAGALRQQMDEANESGDWFQKSIGNVGRGIGLFFTASGQGIGQFFSKIGKSGTELSATNFQLYNDALDTKGVYDEWEKRQRIILWLLLAYAATQDERNLKAVGVTKEMLKSYVGDISKKDFINIYNGASIGDDYYAPQTSYNKPYSTLTAGDMNWLTQEFELHRYGLNKVPYDNYPAFLHEGEAVLTSSTANELRNLVTEYRETNNNSENYIEYRDVSNNLIEEYKTTRDTLISIDNSIQNQTEVLYNKLNDIQSTITNITTSTTIMSASTNDQLRARGRLSSSMSHMYPTKEGLR